MKIKSFFAKPFATYIYKGIRKSMVTAVTDQDNILKSLIKTGRNTEFGKEAGLDKVNDYNEFKQAVPIRFPPGTGLCYCFSPTMSTDLTAYKFGGVHFSECRCPQCGRFGGTHASTCICPHCGHLGGAHAVNCYCPECGVSGGTHAFDCPCPQCSQLG